MSDLATPEGTARYAARMSPTCAASHFRAWPEGSASGLHLSSIGMGAYTGATDDEGDRQYREAVKEAVRSGINVIDCAINYRHMRSERALGEGLRALFDSGEAARDEVFIMTKGGYLPFDASVPRNVEEHFKRTYVEPGILAAEDIVGGSHSIAPKFLEDQLSRSLANFGLKACDVYFLHNIEAQLDEVTPETLNERLRAAFTFLEQKVAEQRIGLFGVATWNGLRVPPDSPHHLSLERMLGIAEEVGGKEHHFRVLQFPFNLGMLEALTTPTQMMGDKLVSLLGAAATAGMMVVTSVPLLQGQVLNHIPGNFTDRMPGLTTQAQRAIQLVRSTPGILAPLVGMKSLEHVRENAALAAVPPLGDAQFFKLFG
jgi:aryl-alcohol dehydrogenase-like predicted oxidoreductase